MSTGLSVTGFIVIAVAVVFAAALQASIGFGMGMLAAPVVALVNPGLIPGTLIILAVVVTLMVVLTERQHVDLNGTGWALAGRVPGTIAGALLVAAMPERWLALMLASVVLLGVVLTSAGWRPAPLRSNLVMAGATSGLLGTATSIGGPPMALVWQGKQGPGYRGTISGFFLFGSAFSVLALALTGSITPTILVAVALLIPAPIVGYGLSRLINRHLSPGRLRWTAISVSCFGALLLIGQQVL